MEVCGESDPQKLRPSISMKRAFTLLLTIYCLGTCWNGGEFYGASHYNSLVLLQGYFDKNPEDADKVVISIKGGANPVTHMPDASPENTRRSLDKCISQLRERKKIDIFEFGRRDPAVPLGETFKLIEREYI